MLHWLRVDVLKSMLNQRPYFWILEWTLREDVQLACVQTPGLFFGLEELELELGKSKAIVVSC